MTAKIHEINPPRSYDTPVSRLARFFEEIAAEIEVYTKNSADMNIVITEVNLAMVSAYKELQQQEEEKNA